VETSFEHQVSVGGWNKLKEQHNKEAEVEGMLARSFEHCLMPVWHQIRMGWLKQIRGGGDDPC